MRCRIHSLYRTRVSVSMFRPTWAKPTLAKFSFGQNFSTPKTQPPKTLKTKPYNKRPSDLKTYLGEGTLRGPPFKAPPFGAPPFGAPPFGAPSQTSLPRTSLRKISLFFSPSPATIFILFFPLWVSFRGILVVFEGRDPQMCTFGLSGCRVKPRRPQSRRGFTRQPHNNTQRCGDAAFSASWADALHKRTPTVVDLVARTMARQTSGVWPSSNRRLIAWTRRVLGLQLLLTIIEAACERCQAG